MKKFWMMLGCVTLLLSGCGDPKADETYESGKKALEKKNMIRQSKCLIRS